MSYMREWSMHRMLARFGLPHLRTRAVRFYINSQYIGLYEAMEPPDMDYVLARGFPTVDLANYALYKVKTSSMSCGSWSADQLSDNIAAQDAAAAEGTQVKYAFNR